ncbi:kazal-type serine peptidase inhibitor domain 3 isoform X1 [Oncorhynchus kisutch]|uniref:Kazal-type serine peptidase inhibitor domain 3 n=2 Tax=Oncorhynchus TaxID=8016 RepID=A0A8C7CVZ4_ONCKI|nr:kazal-type serine protease inhibitor domain-containing protein 1 isoform X1 [Oncorhynchus kisutch]
MPWDIILCGIMLLLNMRTCESFPNKFDEDIDKRIDPLDYVIDPLYYDRLEDQFDRNVTACGECSPELCPVAQECRAGFILDSCGCCQECGNLEGQTCDIGDINVFYGLCGTDLQCKIDDLDVGDGEVAEPQCVCQSQDALCGSDDRTYMNNCQFKEAYFSNSSLKIKRKGPCKTVPIIKVPPQNLVNVTGSSMVFLCEVFAFPMAMIEWKKDGRDIILPGDDPHISVQSRGGPLKYELSSWLQIEKAGLADAGTYRCVARNELGSISAMAVLGVLGPEEMSVYLTENVTEMLEYGHSEREYDEDYY